MDGKVIFVLAACCLVLGGTKDCAKDYQRALGTDDVCYMPAVNTDELPQRIFCLLRHWIRRDIEPVKLNSTLHICFYVQGGGKATFPEGCCDGNKEENAVDLS